MSIEDYKRSALDSMMAKARSDRTQALASLHILLDWPAGIGDHSTSDLHNNLNDSLAKLADADDRIHALKTHFGKYFPEPPEEKPPF